MADYQREWSDGQSIPFASVARSASARPFVRKIQPLEESRASASQLSMSINDEAGSLIKVIRLGN